MPWRRTGATIDPATADRLDAHDRNENGPQHSGRGPLVIKLDPPEPKSGREARPRAPSAQAAHLPLAGDGDREYL